MILGLLLTFSITALFGWQIVGASRTGLYRGIGWSVTQKAHPVLFALYVVVSAIAGVVGLAFAVLLAWLIVS